MKWALEQPTWNEETIEKRADWLFDWARVVWNFEDVEFEVSNNDIEESPTDEVNEPHAQIDDEASAEKRRVNMNNDRKRYSLDGGENYLAKNRFVQASVRKYVELHPELTLAQLKAVFKDSYLRQFKRLGFLCSEADLAKPLTRGRKPTESEVNRWYFMDKAEWLVSADGIPFTVSTQITIESATDVKNLIELEGITVKIQD